MGFSILPKNRGLIRDADTGNYYFGFDGRMSETITHSNSVTSHPVEKGSQNDHIQAQNPTITMSGIISNSHILAQGFSAINAKNRLVQQYEMLSWICEQGLRFDLVTRLKVFEDCVISSVDFTQDKPSDAMTVDVSFKKLLIASTRKVRIPEDILRRKRGKQSLKGKGWCDELGYTEWLKKDVQKSGAAAAFAAGEGPVDPNGAYDLGMAPKTEIFAVGCLRGDDDLDYTKVDKDADKGIGLAKAVVGVFFGGKEDTTTTKDLLDAAASGKNNLTADVIP